MPKLFVLAALVAVVAVLGLARGQPATANTNLVANGDFETPIVTAGAGWDIFATGTTGLGWTVQWLDASPCPASTPGSTAPQLELHNGVNNWAPAEGDQHAELDTDCDGPTGASGTEYTPVRIYQDLPTCAGGTYEIKYSWSPRPGHPDNGLTVEWGGETIGTHSGTGGSNTAWTPVTQTKTASGTTTRLEFEETGATADSLGMFLDAVSVVETLCVITVDIDIKPGSFPNCINPDGHGVIPVAILGSADFDVTLIDPSTVVLDSLEIKAVGKSNKLLAHYEDVNSDGFDDLVVQIQDTDGAFNGGNGTATVSGNLLDGTPFEGTDSICIVP